jgi:two-component system cell cycle sensor histidine kinase/response regulator CckA
MNGFPAEIGAPLQTLLFLLAGGFGAGCFIHAVAARDGGRRTDHLLLSCICLLACGYLALEACGLHLTDLVALAAFRKIQIVLSCTFIAVNAWFVMRSTGARARWMPWCFTLAALAFMAFDLGSEAGLRLLRIERTEPMVLPWGEIVQLARGPQAPTAIPFLATWLLLAGYGMGCALRMRRAPGTIGWQGLFTANAAFLLAVCNDVLLDFSVIRSIYLGSYFLPLLAAAVWWRLAVEDRRRIAFYRELFERSADPAFVHDAGSGSLVEANEAAHALFGRAQGDPLGPLIFPPAAHPGALAGVVAEARARGQRVVEHEFARADGSTFPAELSLRVTSLDGQERVITSLRDLSERRRVERELVENEQRLRTVIERCPIPIAVASLDGRVHSFNPRFTEAYGFTKDDAQTFEQWARLMHSDRAAQLRLEHGWRTAVAGAVAGNGIIPSLRMNFQDRGRRFHQADMCGVVVGNRMFVFLLELTEILGARDELARHEQFLSAVIESASDGICVYSSLLGGKARVVLWNQRMAEITGRTHEEVEAEGWSPAAGSHAAQLGDERVELLNSGHRLKDLEWEIARPDHSPRICSVSTSQLPAPAGERRILVTVRDLTEARLAEAEQRSLAAKVEHAQKLESLGVLAGGIAHDFNNILMSILGRTDLIRLALASDHPAQAELREVKQASRRAADLCQQMLAYAGKGKVQVGPVDLRRLVDDMSGMLEISISKRIAMVSAYEPGVPAILGDASQIQQVVMNLITNASDAIDGKAGTITRRIALARRDAAPTGATSDLPPGSYVCLEISDTGCGMDDHTRSRIFDPFFTTKFTGRGLGMAAVLGIMRAHRGGIEVESEVGRGTTVRALFPAAMVPIPDATPSGAQKLLPRQGTALVVDDDALIRALTADMLVFLGFEVLQAASGSEALAIFAARQRPIAIVILDLTMPDLTGDETFVRLRSIDPGVRVILASGYSRHEVSRMFDASGVSGFLQKPFDVTALAEALGATGG